MTDRAMSDLAALISEPEGVDPADAVRRADLAEAVHKAMSLAEPIDPTRFATARALAAHLDGAASDSDRDATVSVIARSPEALAELDASLALLASVNADHTALPPALLTQARETLLAAQPALPKRTPWWTAGFKAVSPTQLGFSVATLAAVALVVVIAPSRMTAPVTSPAAGDAREATPEAALLGARRSEPAITPPADVKSWRGSVVPAPQRDTGWSAVVMSRSAPSYGAGVNWPTRTQAEVAALAACVRNGSNDCGLAGAADGQCVSAAAGSDRRPVTRLANDKATAEQSALQACGEGCGVVVTACSGH